MQESNFIEYIERFFPGIVLSITETLNDTKRPLTYLYRTMLRRDFSVDGNWNSVSVSNSLVAADVVAIDSRLPLKRRPAKSQASGEIPKMGMKMWLNETQLTQLNTLVKTGAADALIIAKLFNDAPKVIGGVYERIEAIFLQALSTGYALVDDDKNVGTGIRLNYGYMEENKFTAGAAVWGNAGYKPLSDLATMTDKADVDGNTIIRFITDKATINKILASSEANDLVKKNLQVFTEAPIPKPSLTALNAATADEYGYTFQVVDRSIKFEKNGKQQTYKPWEAGSVVGICNDQVGSLIWAELAEQAFPVDGVEYQTADDFILVSKYRDNDPLSEYTTSQARVVPVIDNVDQIYLLDTTVVVG